MDGGSGGRFGTLSIAAKTVPGAAHKKTVQAPSRTVGLVAEDQLASQESGSAVQGAICGSKDGHSIAIQL
jgi:hypothetical protein